MPTAPTIDQVELMESRCSLSLDLTREMYDGNDQGGNLVLYGDWQAIL